MSNKYTIIYLCLHHSLLTIAYFIFYEYVKRIIRKMSNISEVYACMCVANVVTS